MISQELIEKAAKAIEYRIEPDSLSPETVKKIAAEIIEMALPDIRKQVLEEAAKECDRLQGEIRLLSSPVDDPMTKINWVGQETAAIHLGVVIRSLMEKE